MLSIAAVRKNSVTAGLSPRDNKRTEVFFAGCKMARSGHPCPGCFNVDLWDSKYFPKLNYRAVLHDIEKCKNPYVTLVGGEPLDQYTDCIKLMKALSEKHYHICLITHYTMDEIMEQFPPILAYANTIIDGRYEADKRIFDENKKPGVYHVIGSWNQKIWKREGHSWIEIDKDAEDLTKAYDF